MTPNVSTDGVAGCRLPADHGRQALAGHSLANAVIQLPWIAPDASSLAALCRPPTLDNCLDICRDPGLLLLLLRLPEQVAWGRISSSLSLRQWVRTRLADPKPLEEARSFLTQPPAGVVDWHDPRVVKVYQGSLFLAQAARQVANETGCCHPEEAWIAGLLAPLGWMTVAALAPDLVVACIDDPEFPANPQGTQRRHWGLDHAAIARRVARAWRLPEPLAAVAGSLGLPIEAARPFGAEPGLFHAVRRAVGLARGQGFDLGLDGDAPGNLPFEAVAFPNCSLPWSNPYQQPYLIALLAIAAENKRLRDRPGMDRLERDIDALHLAIGSQVAGEAERLRQAKLEAMAEFAGGAGHEINNPLAVISGQAQYLLGHEADLFQNDVDGKISRALHTIIAQTRRVHSLLRELMLFARPAPARPTRIDLPTLLGEVVASAADLASQRQVRIDLATGVDRLPVFLDADQIKTALGCLVRNAVEAAPPEGWVRVSLEDPLVEDNLAIAVEDSGPGPDPGLVPSLFDPFFSGRLAGRGRGLGLPIAWRLSRQHGGNVTLEQMPPQGPTRFVLRLARLTVPEPAAEVLAPDARSLPANPILAKMNQPSSDRVAS